jgi:hypothetical protein
MKNQLQEDEMAGNDPLASVAAGADRIDDALADSFPASDPPSWWAGPAD